MAMTDPRYGLRGSTEILFEGEIIEIDYKNKEQVYLINKIKGLKKVLNILKRTRGKHYDN